VIVLLIVVFRYPPIAVSPHGVYGFALWAHVRWVGLTLCEGERMIFGAQAPNRAVGLLNEVEEVIATLVSALSCA